MHRVPTIGETWSARPPGAAIGEVNPVQGMSGRPKPRSIRDLMVKREIAYRARAPGRRSPRRSRGPGKPDTGRRGDRLIRREGVR